MVLRNTLLSVALAYAAIVALAWGAAQGYVAAGSHWAAALFPTAPNASPTYLGGVWWAAVTTAGLALLAWVLSAHVRLAWRRPTELIAAMFAGLVLAILFLGVGIPAVTAWITSLTNAESSGTGGATGTGAGGPSVGVLPAVVAAVTTMWNGFAKISRESSTSSQSLSLLRSGGSVAWRSRSDFCSLSPS